MTESTSPRASRILMTLTYAIGFVGAFIGFLTLDTGKLLPLSALLAVGITGILSFIRHAIFNRSDAINGGWDYGVVNNFQIEVGLANLAWGIYALLAVVLNWGQQAIAASFLISGMYFAGVVFLIVISKDFSKRKLSGLIGIGSWAIVTIWIGWASMSLAS